MHIRVRGILRTGYLVPVRVCLPVAVGHGTCWLAVAAVGVILCRYHLGDIKNIFHEKYTMVTQPKGIKSPVHPFEKWEMHPEDFFGNVLPTKSLCCSKT